MAFEPLPVNVRFLWVITFFRGVITDRRQLNQLKSAMIVVVVGLLPFPVWALTGAVLPLIPGAVLVVTGFAWARVLMWRQRR